MDGVVVSLSVSVILVATLFICYTRQEKSHTIYT